MVPINKCIEHVNIWLPKPVTSEEVDVKGNDDIGPECFICI